MTDSDPVPRAELTPESILRLAPIAHARMVGSQWFVLGYQLTGLVLGLLAGELLLGMVPVALVIGGRLVPTWPAAEGIPVVLGLIGWSLGLRSAQARHAKKFLAGIRQRGTPPSVEASYEITDEALGVATPRTTHRVPWDAILEILPSPEGWLIQVDMMTFQLPKRAFADEPQERAFIKTLLERIGPEARRRSPEAGAFAP